MRALFFFITICCLSSSVYPQKSRYRFAESYVGLATEFSPQQQTFSQIENGRIIHKDLPNQLHPRILIGGTHFWGHADFYLSIPLASFPLSGNKDATYSNNVITGFRFYPFKLKSQSLRPFTGLGFNRMSLQLANGPTYGNWQTFTEAGLSYRTKQHFILGVSAHYFPNTTFQTAIDREQFSETKLNNYTFSLSIKKVMDFSRSYESENNQRFFAKPKEELKQENKLNTYSVGLGWSAYIPLERSEHASRKPFFNDEIEGNVGLDMALGYYFHQTDAAIRLSYRRHKQEETAFDYSYSLNKQSLALEAFKFLFDFHGFVPFVGPFAARDYYHLNEKDVQRTVSDHKEESWGYGLVFGWDIRLSETDFFILRTNLRYNPKVDLKQNGLTYTSNAIEFNFIQLVFYPERWKAYKSLINQ